MTKKNILTAAVSLSLVACLSIGATLAYFTDSTDGKKNVFETGKVDITLTDDGRSVPGEGKGGTINKEGGYDYTDIQPGDLLRKEVYVDVANDSSDCFVAVRVSFESTTGYPSETELQARVVDAMNRANTTTKWEAFPVKGSTDMIYMAVGQNNDYRIHAGETLNLFDNIKIPELWDNDYLDGKFSITVSAYAAQYENLTEDKFIDMILGNPIDVNGTETVVPFEKVPNA